MMEKCYYYDEDGNRCEGSKTWTETLQKRRF